MIVFQASKMLAKWIFTGRTEAEAPILWPPNAKSRLNGKDPEAGKDWKQKKKEAAEDEKDEMGLLGHKPKGHVANSHEKCSSLLSSPAFRWRNRPSKMTQLEGKDPGLKALESGGVCLMLPVMWVLVPSAPPLAPEGASVMWESSAVRKCLYLGWGGKQTTGEFHQRNSDRLLLKKKKIPLASLCGREGGKDGAREVAV